MSAPQVFVRGGAVAPAMGRGGSDDREGRERRLTFPVAPISNDGMRTNACGWAYAGDDRIVTSACERAQRNTHLGEHDAASIE